MKKLITIAVLLLSVKAMALTEQQETYAMFCGSRVDLTEFAISKGERITAKDIKELSETRAPVLDVLANGNEGLSRMLDEGNRTDTGAFGAIAACGIIVQLEKEIKKAGCYNLKTNKAVVDNGGIKACKALMAKLPH